MRRKQSVLRSISLANFRVEIFNLYVLSFRKTGKTAIPVQLRDGTVINTSVTIALCRFRKKSSPNALREKHYYEIWATLFIFFFRALNANVCSKREFKKRACKFVSQVSSNKIKIIVQFTARTRGVTLETSISRYQCTDVGRSFLRTETLTPWVSDRKSTRCSGPLHLLFLPPPSRQVTAVSVAIRNEAGLCDRLTVHSPFFLLIRLSFGIQVNLHADTSPNSARTR